MAKDMNIPITSIICKKYFDKYVFMIFLQDSNEDDNRH